MDDKLRAVRPPRWPALLLLAGVAGLLPFDHVARGQRLLEDFLLTVRVAVETTLRFGRVQALERSAQAEPAAPDPRVAELLSVARARVLPGRSSGWQRDGRFATVAVGRTRTPERIALATPAPLPDDEPVFVGSVLLGTTSSKATKSSAGSAGGTSFVAPLTAKGTRIPAVAGVVGRREVRLVAVGEGKSTLRVSYADSALPLEVGDLVYALDPPSQRGGAVARRIGGALIGRIVRGELPEGAARIEWRIEPALPPAKLAEVAVRLPPGFPAPGEVDLYPIDLPFERSGEAVAFLDHDRVGQLFRLGREEGITPGCAVSDGPLFVGRVVRAGWHGSVVRGVSDPGFELRVLVLARGEVVSWPLKVRGAVEPDGTAALAGRPPLDDFEGALVVTAPASDGVPEGLIVGTLAARGEECRLRFAERSDERRFAVHRIGGAWSDDG